MPPARPPRPIRIPPWLALAIAALASATTAPALAQTGTNGNPGGSTVITSSTHELLTFLPPTTVNQQANAYATEIIGRLAGGAALFDVTVLDAFGSAGMQAALASARTTLLAAGGPGTAIAAPALLSSASATSSASNSIYSLDPSFYTDPKYAVVTSTQTFGPATVNGYAATQPPQPSTVAQPGVYSLCGGDGTIPGFATGLPSATKPTCSTVDGGTFTVLLGQLDTNIDTTYIFPINTTTTVTDTTTLTQAYELVGTPAAAPTGVPEPAGWTVLAAGLAALGLLARRPARM